MVALFVYQAKISGAHNAHLHCVYMTKELCIMHISTSGAHNAHNACMWTYKKKKILLPIEPARTGCIRVILFVCQAKISGAHNAHCHCLYINTKEQLIKSFEEGSPDYSGK